MAEAVVHLKFPIERDAVHAVLDQEPHLAKWGYGVLRDRGESYAERRAEFEQSRRDMLSACGAGEFMLAVSFLGLFRHRKTINGRTSSYGLKHLAENYHCGKGDSDNYVGNGMLIAAAIHLGFKVRPKGINAHLNISLASAQGSPLRCRHEGNRGTAGETRFDVSWVSTRFVA